jgi:uncharacterized integral membrane protein
LAVLIDAFAISPLSAPLRVVLAGLWTIALYGWTGSLGACFLSEARSNGWYERWVGGGLLALLLVVFALITGFALDLDLFLRQAGPAALLAAFAPITVGLTARMLPHLGGVGPVDREAVRRSGRDVPLWTFLLCIGLLIDVPLVAAPAALALAWRIAGVARSVRWFALRTEGGLVDAAGRQAPPNRDLRLLARGAWLALLLGWLLVSGALAMRAVGVAPSSLPPPRTLWLGGLHSVGIGFLAGMMFGVSQRVLPAFVAGELRWPRLRKGAAALLLGALLFRLCAVFLPTTTAWALHGSLWLMLLAATLFLLQIGPSWRFAEQRAAGGVREVAGCPSAPSPRATP